MHRRYADGMQVEVPVRYHIAHRRVPTYARHVGIPVTALTRSVAVRILAYFCALCTGMNRRACRSRGRVCPTHSIVSSFVTLSCAQKGDRDAAVARHRSARHRRPARAERRSSISLCARARAKFVRWGRGGRVRRSAGCFQRR